MLSTICNPSETGRSLGVRRTPTLKWVVWAEENAVSSTYASSFVGIVVANLIKFFGNLLNNVIHTDCLP